MRYALPLFLAAAVALMLAAPVEADRPRRDSLNVEHREKLNLPMWSAPQSPDELKLQGFASEEVAPDAVDKMIPGPPDPADQVPLGGLEWLALAGGAYAVNRLRRRDGEDDASDDGDALP